MNPTPLFDRDISSYVPEFAPSSTFLQQGLESLRQGKDAEGIALCLLARERFTPEQAEIAGILDVFLASYTRYWQAQQSFHEAGRRFVEAEAEWQRVRQSVEGVLPALREESPHIVLPYERQPAPDEQNGHSARQGMGYAAYQGAQQYPAVTQSTDCESEGLPALSITMFGCFTVRRQGQPLALCQNRNGQAILRYLAAQANHRASRDSLMGLLWPEDDPDTARHKVQVAISALRHSLNHGLRCPSGKGYILYETGNYQLNPSVSIISDVEQFIALYQYGRRSNGETTITHFEQACRLYVGPFLVEDLYADWSIARREQVCHYFLTMCHALAAHYMQKGHYEQAEHWTRTILHENRCDEEAHRQLIQVYLAQGRRSDAVKQFQVCARILAEELGVQPMNETQALLRDALLDEQAQQDRAETERR